MSRKRIPRWPAQPPRGLRPKLARDQVRDLSLVHHVNLDAIATGLADEVTLWQAVGGALTWCRVAEKLERGVDEMTEQMNLLERVVERYERCGRVGFTGEEYQLAKVGVMVMDQLAELVDLPTAIAAANWSEETVNRMAAASARPQEQAA